MLRNSGQSPGEIAANLENAPAKCKFEYGMDYMDKAEFENSTGHVDFHDLLMEIWWRQCRASKVHHLQERRRARSEARSCIARAWGKIFGAAEVSDG